VSDFVSPEDVAALEDRLLTLENDVEQMKAVIVKTAVHTGTLTEDQAKNLLKEQLFILESTQPYQNIPVMSPARLSP
jgi:polyhydroxyalkanoate synthesis regulator phasin